MAIYYTYGDISKRTWLSPQTVRQAAARGELTPGARTRGGIALVSQTEAERFIESRNAALGRDGTDDDQRTR